MRVFDRPSSLTNLSQAPGSARRPGYRCFVDRTPTPSGSSGCVGILTLTSQPTLDRRPGLTAHHLHICLLSIRRRASAPRRPSCAIPWTGTTTSGSHSSRTPTRAARPTPATRPSRGEDCRKQTHESIGDQHKSLTPDRFNITAPPPATRHTQACEPPRGRDGGHAEHRHPAPVDAGALGRGAPADRGARAAGPLPLLLGRGRLPPLHRDARHRRAALPPAREPGHRAGT